MNVFFLHRNPVVAATYHCDKHVRKMVIESAQMLTNAYYASAGICSASQARSKPIVVEQLFEGLPRTDDSGRPRPYSISHPHHPCTAWARASAANFDWLLTLASWLGSEYVYRWKRHHAVSPILHWMNSNRPKLPGGSLTDPPQAMPACFRGDDPVEAYRRLYHYKASVFDVTWKHPREAPDWFSLDGVTEAKRIFEEAQAVIP